MVTVGLASQYGHLSDYKAAITICFWTDISPTANWPRLQWVLITPCTTALVGRILDHSWTLLDHMSTFGHLSLSLSCNHQFMSSSSSQRSGWLESPHLTISDAGKSVTLVPTINWLRTLHPLNAFTIAPRTKKEGNQILATNIPNIPFSQSS